MTQPAATQIEQDTIGTGNVGESFKGGSLADAGGGLANKVVVTNTNPQTASTDVKMFWVPHDGDGVKLDIAAEGNLNQVSPHVWEFQPTAGVWGKWIVRSREVVSGANVDEFRVFGIPSPTAGVFEPGFNEAAGLTASLLNAGAAQVADSWDNENGTVNGWQKDLRRFAEKIEANALSGSAADAGAVLLGTTWNFDGASQADANPGMSKFRLDNADPDLATLIYVNKQGVNLPNMRDFLDTLDAGFFIHLQQKGDPTRWVPYKVTGPVIGAVGYVKIPVVKMGAASGAAIQDLIDIEFLFLGGAGGGPVTHASTTGQTADDHHSEAHTVASHSDTTATGAELDTLTDGSETTLHSHAANVVQTGPVVDNFITGATGADNGAGPGGAGDEVGTLGGDGGDGTTGGGSGGAQSLIGGDGGASSVSGNGGLAGFATIAGGKGGAADGASGNGGDGGDVELFGGEGGPSASADQGNGGSFVIDGGSGTLLGQVRIGTGDTRDILSGNIAGSQPKWKHQGGLYTPTKDLGTSGTTVTPDLADSNVFKITINGNTTLTFANISDGQSGHIHVTQDGIGSRTMVKGAGVVMPGGAIALSGGAGETDTLAYVVEGANVRVWIEALDFS